MDSTQVQTKTRTVAKTDTVVNEFDKATFFTLSAVAVAFGIFAFTSIVGAIATGGIGSLFSGFVIAIGLV